jgi:N-acetylglucosamine kinase-like BadF-type ATPase
MKLIVDSGSTKSSWGLLEGKEHKSTVNTAGLNPYFHTSESIDAILKAELIPFTVTDHIKEIHFYGAGCSTENNEELIRGALLNYFHQARVWVYHDIFGAARALFGNNQGISCILGTGCNCCYYDGQEIYSKIDSLGYLFGDEGAGSYLGKNLMADYLRKSLPNDLREEFDSLYRLTLEDILNALYNLPYPNRFLASFSEFLAPRQGHLYVHKLVKDSFLAFFAAQVMHYEGYRDMDVGFVGSIAHIYRGILEEAAAEKGIQVGNIIKAPLEGLLRFHSS